MKLWRSLHISSLVGLSNLLLADTGHCSYSLAGLRCLVQRSRSFGLDQNVAGSPFGLTLLRGPHLEIEYSDSNFWKYLFHLVCFMDRGWD